MLKFNVKFKGVDKGKKKSKNTVRRVLMRSMFKMEELAIQKAPTDQGELRQKISLFPQILADKYFLTSGAGYSASMEYGSRPFYAPIDPLKAWARRKLGDENIGYAVRAKIAKEGITAQPFMRPALFEVKSLWYPKFLREEFSSI